MPRKYAGPLQKGKKSAYVPKRKKSKPKAKPGLNTHERTQVKKMIKGQREVFYLETVQYALGQGVQSNLHKHQITPHSCFGSANKITMVGLLSADTFTSIGNDVNGNATYTGGVRLHLTGGCNFNHLNNIPDKKLDGDMAYMKSHLQKIKIHARTLWPSNDSQTQDKLIPLCFRVLVVQVNGNKPAGNFPSFTNVGSTGSPSLFRDRFNTKKGIDDPLLPYEFTNGLRVDTKAFKVVRDINFKLSNPILFKNSTTTNDQHNSTNANLQYPATKELDLWLPQPKRPVKYDRGTFLPTNYDYRYYTFVFCTSDSTYGSSSALGTTEDRWCLESTSTVRVGEY